MDRRSPAERYEFVSVDILMLPVRAENALLNANIDTIGRLIRLTEMELEAITGISPHAMGKLKAALADRNLWLVERKREPTKEPVKEPPRPERPVISPQPPPAPPPVLQPAPVAPVNSALTISMITREAMRVLDNSLKLTEKLAATPAKSAPAATPAEPAPKPVPAPPPPRTIARNYERGSSAFVTNYEKSWIFRNGYWQLLSNSEIQKVLEWETKARQPLTENSTG